MPLHTVDPLTADTITASLAGAAWVISPRFGESYSFDRAGRLLALFLDERSYQRTLDHRLLERQRGTTRRRELPAEESNALLDRAFVSLSRLADSLGRLDIPADERQWLADALACISALDPDQLASDGAAFRNLYLPVSILPPDQYLALVLQATEGCSWNRCTFCGLYKDRAFRIKAPDDFRAHALAVRDFFREGLSLRRGIFLADANALVMPQARLRAIFQITQEIFGDQNQPRPVYSFVSAFDVDRKSPDNWAELHALGLERAYIGLETGDNELLHFLNKPGLSEDAINAVQSLRAGGVAVGVIVMAGIGGDRFAQSHVQRTIEVIRAMDLGPNDLVYLSNYVPAPDTEYPFLTTVAGIRNLTDEEVTAQLQEMQRGIRAVAPQTRAVPYHVDGFAL